MDWTLQTYDPNAINHFGFDNPLLYLMMAIIIIPTVFAWYYGPRYIQSIEKKGERIKRKKEQQQKQQSR